jgi:hypothetical protein
MAAAPVATVAVPTPSAPQGELPVAGSSACGGAAATPELPVTGCRPGPPREGGSTTGATPGGCCDGGRSTTGPTSGGSTWGVSPGGRTSGGGADAACAVVMDTTCTAGTTQAKLATAAAPRRVVRRLSRCRDPLGVHEPFSSLFISPLLSPAGDDVRRAAQLPLRFAVPRPLPGLPYLPQALPDGLLRGFTGRPGEPFAGRLRGGRTPPGGADAACAVVIDTACTAGATQTAAAPIAAPRRAVRRVSICCWCVRASLSIHLTLFPC